MASLVSKEKYVTPAWGPLILDQHTSIACHIQNLIKIDETYQEVASQILDNWVSRHNGLEVARPCVKCALSPTGACMPALWFACWIVLTFTLF